MGASNKNAQDNIQPKGNKKPLQVLHISKKDSQEINNEQNNSQEDIKKENVAIKPQIIKDKSIKGISTQILTNPEFSTFFSKEENTPFKKSVNFKSFFITY